MGKEVSQTNFLNNLEYILIHLEKDIDEANNLEDKMYFELFSLNLTEIYFILIKMKVIVD